MQLSQMKVGSEYVYAERQYDLDCGRGARVTIVEIVEFPGSPWKKPTRKAKVRFETAYAEGWRSTHIGEEKTVDSRNVHALWSVYAEKHTEVVDQRQPWLDALEALREAAGDSGVEFFVPNTGEIDAIGIQRITLAQAKALAVALSLSGFPVLVSSLEDD